MSKQQVDCIRKVAPGISDRVVRDLVAATLAAAGVRSSVCLTIIWTGDGEVRRMNRLYRGKDKTTDVLSFPLGDEGMSGRARILGDIFISVPEAKREAKKEGRIYREELQLLLVHGVLHLLGYDHEARTDRAKMFPLQNRILKKTGAHESVLLPVD